MPGGRPKSTQPLIERFMSRVEVQPDGCWYWTGAIGKNGYGLLSVSCLESWGTRAVHRWSYIHHKGPITDDLMVRHTCDVRRCVNPAHLVLGHSIDNVHDMLERNPNGCHRKLSAEQVREIRNAYKSEPFPSQTELAERYGLSATSVGNVLNGRSYGYVSD